MRREFQKLYEQDWKARHQFIATFERNGRKDGFRGYTAITILLLNVKSAESGESSEILEDHIWMNLGKRFEKLKLKSGDIIKFSARIGLYQKGYREDDEENPFRLDYKLEYPTKMEIIGHDDTYSDEENQRILAKIEENNRQLHESRVNFVKGLEGNQNMQGSNIKTIASRKEENKIEKELSQLSLLDFL